MVALSNRVPFSVVLSKTAPVSVPPEKINDANCAFTRLALVKSANCTLAASIVPFELGVDCRFACTRLALTRVARLRFEPERMA